MTNSDRDPRASLLLGRQPFNMKRKWYDSKAITLPHVSAFTASVSFKY